MSFITQEENELSEFEFEGDGDKNVKNWKKIKRIGYGNFSHVYHGKAFKSLTEWDIAVKEINFTFDNNETAFRAATTETNALIRLSHKRIVSFYGFCPQEFVCFIFIEYMPLGSLNKFIRSNAISKAIAQLFTRQILEGIQYLHGQRVLHRDIKTGNILMSGTRSVKLSDFGLSKIFEEFSKASTTGIGTIRYMAPEMFWGNYSYPVDIWALGCVVVEMLTGDYPFANLERQQVMFALAKENNSPLQYVSQKLPDLAEQLLKKIFKYRPEQRPLADDLINDDNYIKETFIGYSKKESQRYSNTHFNNCKKNPGHADFFSIEGLKLQHLPEDHREKDLYELIKAVADLTVKLTTTIISSNRPEFFSNTKQPYPLYKMAGYRNLRTYSGEIIAVIQFIDGRKGYVNENIPFPITVSIDTDYKSCTCRKCKDSDSPSNEWYEIYITTTTSSVFDEIEAIDTTCRLFYDGQSGPLVSLDGFNTVMVDIERDFCMIKCLTCDISLATKLQIMDQRKNDFLEKALKKYKGSTLCFIVSHPHTREKHVTFGHCLERIILSKFNEKIKITKLMYTTATCPGSEGASVYCIGMRHAHVHSGSSNSKLNYSSIGYSYKN